MGRALLWDEANSLGVLVDHKLRFEEHMQTIVTKAEQQMHIARNFVYLRTRPLATMFFKSFIIALLTYCLPILYTHVHVFAWNKIYLKNFFSGAGKLDLDVGNSDNFIQQCTKSLATTYIHEDEHFVNAFLDKCPLGRYDTLKHRKCSLGKDCFLRHFIHTCILNDILF